VCRRFHRLANSPQLLRGIQLNMPASKRPDVNLQRVDAACEWLVQRAAGHVQHLQLELPYLHYRKQAERSNLLAEALAACGTAGGLKSLRFTTSVPLNGRNWVLAMRNLRSLSVTTARRMDISTYLTALTALEQLLLSGLWDLQPDVCLPPSLTRLHLEGEGSESLPPQVCGSVLY